MVKYSSQTLDHSLYALSDPTRRALLARIAAGEICITTLAEPFDMSLAAISKHLQVLEKAKLLKKTKLGRTVTCQATLEPLQEVYSLLEELGRYWNQQLNSLEMYLSNNLNIKENKYEQRTRKSRKVIAATRNQGKKR